MRGAPRCRERPAFVLQTRGIRWKCRGFAIRYSLLTSSPLTPSRPLSPLPFLPPSIPSGIGISPLRSAHVFRLYTACNVWALYYLSYSLSRRSRMGCTLYSTGPPFTTLGLIMLILPQRRKLNHSKNSPVWIVLFLFEHARFSFLFSIAFQSIDRAFPIRFQYFLDIPRYSRDVDVEENSAVFSRVEGYRATVIRVFRFFSILSKNHNHG